MLYTYACYFVVVLIHLMLACLYANVLNQHCFQTITMIVLQSATSSMSHMAFLGAHHFYPSPIQLLHVYGPIAHRVLQDGPKIE